MDMNYGGGGMWEGGGWAGWKWSGGEWDNCNSIINKYIKKKKEGKKKFRSFNKAHCRSFLETSTIKTTGNIDTM